MQPFETIYVAENVVACNGGGGALGHPLVYLNLSADGKVECPYCSRLFIRGSAPHNQSAPQAPAS
ncbi:MAG TPA: zinc-finger domain-containing protein [Stellaceae bacterium]|nr:zinc-finger domain-containing protein [Stellaceae bacterium]